MIVMNRVTSPLKQDVVGAIPTGSTINYDNGPVAQ